MIKAGIVGLGKMGLSHCAIVNANPDVELIAVCDTSTFILDAFKKYASISCYTDYKEMLSKEKLDCIIVATPTKYHYRIVNDSLQKRLHVFCEKPFCISSEEGKAMVDAVEKEGLVNQVGYHNRFLGTFNELKRLIDKQVIGEVYHFIGEAYGPVVIKEKTGSWRSNRAEGGGCLFDYASHVINLIQFVLGKPRKASGSLLKSVFSKDVEDAVFSSLTLNNGISGQLAVNWSDETYRKMSTSLTVYGKRGKIICDATEIKIYLTYNNPQESLEKGWTVKYLTELTKPVAFYLRGEEYTSQLDYFFENIKDSNKYNINSFREAYATDLTIDLIFNDAKTI